MPGVSPFTAVEGAFGLLKLEPEGPEATDQLPEPITGVLPVSNAEVTLQRFCAVPAMALVGNAYTRTSVESFLLQPVGGMAVIR